MNFARIVAKYRPTGWRLRFPTRPRDSAGNQVSGLTNFSTKVLTCKPVTDLVTLQVFLHEVGHVVLHMEHETVSYVEEYEAEMWSFATLVTEGFTVNKLMQDRAKANVRSHLMRTEHWAIIEWATEPWRTK
jgi:hypothetical protein